MLLELPRPNIYLLNVVKPYRMFEYKYSRSQYYEDRVLAKVDSSRHDIEHVVSEGYNSIYDGDWDHDENRLFEKRVYEGAVTMFVVFDYETKELVKADGKDDVMFYSSLKDAYDDQEDLVDCEQDFNKRLLIFEVPEMKKDEVKTDVSNKVKTFAGTLKKTATSEGGWHTNK